MRHFFGRGMRRVDAPFLLGHCSFWWVRLGYESRQYFCWCVNSSSLDEVGGGMHDVVLYGVLNLLHCWVNMFCALSRDGHVVVIRVHAREKLVLAINNRTFRPSIRIFRNSGIQMEYGSSSPVSDSTPSSIPWWYKNM
ncbi:hypothetical protein AKJ16_DCAP23473 [Drosera capensis]